MGSEGWYDENDGGEAVARELERRRGRGEVFLAVAAPQGKKLACQFWGLAWQRHLEGLADYESRLPRGRSYLKKGAVFNLAIEPGLVTAVVTGQAIYEVEIRIALMKGENWALMRAACVGQIPSLMELMSGKIGAGVMRSILDPELGLFPGYREIKLWCSCPDSADLCKHVAAVLYAVGLEFDGQPETFFRLRGVDHMELLATAADSLTDGSVAASEAVIIPDSDVAGLFGLD